jgi:hypothetical protein
MPPNAAESTFGVSAQVLIQKREGRGLRDGSLRSRGDERPVPCVCRHKTRRQRPVPLKKKAEPGADTTAPKPTRSKDPNLASTSMAPALFS